MATFQINLDGIVKSVNSEIPDASGNIQIDKSDIGLENVDNTSDLNKPVSLATQTEIDTKQDKLYINVKDYGAIGDGITDDSSAIQLAITNGGEIYFPSGTYLFSNITLNSNTLIRGSGVGITNFKLNSSTTPLFNLTSKSNVYFEYATFLHDKTHVRVGLSGILINATSCKNSGVSNCEFNNFNSHALYIRTTDSDATKAEGLFINKCVFRDAGTSAIAIFLDNQAEYCTISSCRFVDLKAFNIVNSANTIINGNVLLNSSIVSTNSSGLNGGKISITNNKINHTSTAITLTTSNSASQYGSLISGNEILANTTYSVIINGGKGNLITGNRFWSTTGGGIQLNDYLTNVCDYNLITSNISVVSNLVIDSSTGTNTIVSNNIQNTPNT